MEEKYIRNRIYVTAENQERIKDFRILLGGAGIGSIIAECAVRFGFETITIVDGDKVEESNLNRQNYLASEVGRFKAEALLKRLRKINPKAKIKVVNKFIDLSNVREIINGHDIAINALDFKSDIPFVFDEICKESNITVLHPYNFGWAGFLTIVSPCGFQLTELSTDYHNFELKITDHVLKYGKFWGLPIGWLDGIVEEYKQEDGTLPPPQLSIGAWIVAGYCVNAIYNIAIGKDVLYFPKFYLSSLLGGAF